jgi:hypothetical protein
MHTPVKQARDRQTKSARAVFPRDDICSTFQNVLTVIRARHAVDDDRGRGLSRSERAQGRGAVRKILNLCFIGTSHDTDRPRSFSVSRLVAC